jgi:hypothetical protein
LLLAKPEFYSHLVSWWVVIRTPDTERCQSSMTLHTYRHRHRQESQEEDDVEIEKSVEKVERQGLHTWKQNPSIISKYDIFFLRTDGLFWITNAEHFLKKYATYKKNK